MFIFRFCFISFIKVFVQVVFCFVLQCWDRTQGLKHGRQVLYHCYTPSPTEIFLSWLFKSF